MRQELKLHGRGTHVLLNAALWADMPIALHPSDEQAVTLTAFSSVPPRALTVDAKPSSSSSSSSSTAAAAAPAATPRTGPQSYNFLLRFSSVAAAGAFVSTVQRLQAALATYAAATARTGCEERMSAATLDAPAPRPTDEPPPRAAAAVAGGNGSISGSGSGSAAAAKPAAAAV